MLAVRWQGPSSGLQTVGFWLLSWRKRSREPCRVLRIKALIQFIKASPLRPNHPPTVSGIRASTCTLKGHIQSTIPLSPSHSLSGSRLTPHKVTLSNFTHQFLSLISELCTPHTEPQDWHNQHLGLGGSWLWRVLSYAR